MKNPNYLQDTFVVSCKVYKKPPQKQEYNTLHEALAFVNKVYNDHLKEYTYWLNNLVSRLDHITQTQRFDEFFKFDLNLKTNYKSSIIGKHIIHKKISTQHLKLLKEVETWMQENCNPETVRLDRAYVFRFKDASMEAKFDDAVGDAFEEIRFIFNGR